MDEHKKELLKNLPKIDEMMLLIERGERLDGVPRELVKEACRSVVEELRGRILADKGKNEDLCLPMEEEAAGWMFIAFAAVILYHAFAGA